jgi:acyl transferase domain-containing protein/NADPH:quinone reductase-like Zn-dependent oxidoreductase/aryl carrier-like protein
VAGCNLLFSPEFFEWLSNMNMLSPDSKSYSFDHRANGYARGEGIAVMIVKRLSDAIRDGNTIRAVIRSTGANEDGHTPGITQPSQAAQERLMKETYARAGLSMALTRYVEAHGTGTPLGDPLEATAIGNAFRSFRSEAEPLYIGSVKSNIGHLEGASGLAGVIKVVLALENGLIPPNTEFEKLNPRIDADRLRIRIPVESTSWPSPGLRRASVNSFGYGGANCHIVLDDAYNYLQARGIQAKHNTVARPPTAVDSNQHLVKAGSLAKKDFPATTHKTPRLLVLSSSDKLGIRRLATSYEDHVSKLIQDHCSPLDLIDDIAYTLDSHRSVLAYRSSIVAHSLEDLVDLGNAFPTEAKSRESPPQLGFIFTGQGAQWFAMGRELLDYPIYRRSIEEASTYLATLGCSWSASDELTRSPDSSNVDLYSQALCTIVQVALVDILNQINIKPAVVVGHSSGEIAAAYAAGYISRQDAWKIAYCRGVVTSKLSKSNDHGSGAMLSVGLPMEEVLPYIKEVLLTETGSLSLTVACINSPKNVTVAGDKNAIRALKSRLDAQGAFARELRVRVAYHSPQMQAVADAYMESLGVLSGCHTPQQTVTMISSVSGNPIDADALCKPGYWVQNMVSPVLFSSAVSEMCSLVHTYSDRDVDQDSGTAFRVDHLIEIGPHSALKGPLREILRSMGREQEILYDSVLVRGEPATTTFLNVAGALWCTGHPVDIRAVNECDVLKDSGCVSTVPKMLVNLPSYPFDHTERFWWESRLSRAYRFRDQVPHDLLGSRCSDWSPLDARWRFLIRERELPWIADHIVNGKTVYPGTGMLAMAVEGAKQLADSERFVSGYVLRNVEFRSAMSIEDAAEALEVLTSLRPSNSDTFDFSISSYTDQGWIQNCRGSIGIEYEMREDAWNTEKRMERLADHASNYQQKATQCIDAVDETTMYRRLKAWGLDYGPTFQIARSQMVSTHGEAVAKIVTFEGDGEDLQPHVIHPVTFDAIGHLCFVAFTAGGKKPMATSMPQKLDYAWISASGLAAPVASSVLASSTIVGETPRGFVADYVVVDANNSTKVQLCMQGLRLAFISDVPRELELPNPAQQWYNMERKVDLSMLSWSEVRQCLHETCMAPTDPIQMAYRYIELAAHQTPGMRVCQPSAGNEEYMQQILDNALDRRQSGNLSCASYVFADSIHENVEHARKSFARYGAKMEFHVFDPVSESRPDRFDIEDHDLVVALHHSWTAADLLKALAGLRKTLKLRGKIIIEDPTPGEGAVCNWDEVLRQSGFSGVDLYLEGGDVAKGIVISTATEESISHRNVPAGIQIIIVGDFANEKHNTLARRLSGLMTRSLALHVVQLSLTEASQRPDLKECLLIMLSDPEHLCLEALVEKSFYHLQRIVLAVSHMLWVSDLAAEGCSGGSPVSAIIEGSARSFRSENNDTRFVTLALESFEEVRSAEHTFEVVRRILSTPAGSHYEQEYVEVAGRLNIDRIVEASDLKHRVNKKLKSEPRTEKLKDRNFKLGISQIGNLDTVRYFEQTALSTEPRPDEVDIEVRAVAIGSRDYRRAMGKAQSIQFGNACTGTIVKAGLQSGFEIGDRVFCMGEDTFRSRFRTLRENVRKVPEAVDFVDCCSIIPALTAAHYALVDVGRWRSGETVLVYPSGSFIAQAAIRVCQDLGATVWTTVDDEGQSKTLSEQFGIPGTAKLSRTAFDLGRIWRDPKFPGADVVLCTEPVANHQSWDFVNKFGRVIYMPSITGAPILSTSFQHVPPNISYSALDFQEMAVARPKDLEDAVSHAFDILVNDPEARTAESFSASQVVEAFKRVGSASGPVVVTLEADDEIELASGNQYTTTLDAGATYVICGGTGGIGRGIARWCAARGARNLILLSRSGAKGKEAQELVTELTDQGVHVETPPCDLADEEALRMVLRDCTIRMPPIKGCVQASGAFKDLSFEKMVLDDWNVAIRNKVTASWNLHRALPVGLDFFIMTSSMSGVLGMISQSSYAGANMYQNALARHRLSLGEKAASLDLGIVQDAGFLTDGQKERLDRMGLFVFSCEAEIHALLDIYCDPANDMQSSTGCRPISGFKTVAQMVADGVEVPWTFEQPLWEHTHYAHVENTTKSQVATTELPVRTLIEAANTMAEAVAIATDALRKRVAVLLSTSEERLLEGSAIQSYGLDSLVAIELRNWLQKAFGVDVAVFEIVGGASFVAVGGSIAKKVRGTETNGV